MRHDDPQRGPSQPGSDAAVVAGVADDRVSAGIRSGEARLGPAFRLVTQRRVLAAGLAMIAVQLIWRGVFVGHEYFRQDDFYNLDLPLRSSFGWRYLTFIGPGHLMIGPRAVAWVLARTSLYNWGLAAAITVALQGCAGLAALRLLRALFDDRPAVLIPLAVYLLCPLTLPALGFWTAALESVPLQIAIFMALDSHVRYVRTGRVRHLIAAEGWVMFGLLFFAKAMILPVLLFALTAGFLPEDRSWLAGARGALVRYWKAWVLYALPVAAYAIVLASSLHTAVSAVALPASFGSIVNFAWLLLRETFLPGALGGPWQWAPPGGSYALAAPPAGLAWLALIVAVVLAGWSVARRRVAWRSLGVLVGWIAAADIAPVILGRARFLPAAAFWHETRYVADAVPVLVVCMGLALWPIVGQATEWAPARHLGTDTREQAWRAAIPALIGVFVFGSAWSSAAYQTGTSAGAASAAEYISNAGRALTLIPDGTHVVNGSVPGNVMNALFGTSTAKSAVIGAMARGQLAGRVRWVTHPEGTIDLLRTFGTDGRLWLARVYGAASPRLPAGRGCWPERHGRIVIRVAGATPAGTATLRIGYLWRSTYSSLVDVRYGNAVQPLDVQPGLHSGYLPVIGRAAVVVVSNLSGVRMCVGDVQAGFIGPIRFGPAIP